MIPEPLTPANTSVVLIDYAVGFAPMLRSHDLAEHINAVTGLAKTARLYGSSLVVTNGEEAKPSGPLYPELVAAIGDQPVVTRTSPRAFNSFLDDGFAAAVRATGRPNLAIGGIATDGCVLQSVLGGLREGYAVYVVVDAAASPSREAHEAAIQRMTLAGAIPVTWWSLAAEFQLDPAFEHAPYRMQLMEEFMPAQMMSARTFFAGQAQGRHLATAG